MKNACADMKHGLAPAVSGEEIPNIIRGDKMTTLEKLKNNN